jgi:hypothetical protein
LLKVHRLLTRGLQATALLWPAIALVYAWVLQAARVLANPEQASATVVEQQYTLLLAEMRAAREQAGSLASAVDHFLKVTRSYAPHLFHCYDVPGLPRTNNDLEHYFGAARYHERRAAGRKGADPGTVVRGSVRLLAAVATRQRPVTAEELRPRDLARWRAVRAQLAARHETRRAQRRFRRNPAAYLAALEAQALKASLPA